MTVPQPDKYAGPKRAARIGAYTLALPLFLMGTVFLVVGTVALGAMGTTASRNDAEFAFGMSLTGIALLTIGASLAGAARFGGAGIPLAFAVALLAASGAALGDAESMRDLGARMAAAGEFDDAAAVAGIASGLRAGAFVGLLLAAGLLASFFAWREGALPGWRRGGATSIPVSDPALAGTADERSPRP